ncbi:MAG: hypothetical protein FWE19_06305 [Oscillospiraceae bacterium]|nr:hypothetical protein [Oscillospiraceae bacterium]
MPARTVISYPHMGSYSAVLEQLFGRLFPHATILTPPPITQKTVELGGRCSPDFVCSPFKYNLGNYIEGLEAGANLLFQSGTGCRYGYYGELQEQILRDMGHRFEFACLARKNARPLPLLTRLWQLGCPLPAHKVAAAFHMAVCSIRAVDSLENWIRENIAFERVPGSCDTLHEQFLDKISRTRSQAELRDAVADCQRQLCKIKLDCPQNHLRVGIIGEVYTLMEPASNFNLERQLAAEGVAVTRAMSIWFLMFGRDNATSLRRSEGYLRYPVGATGVDSVSQSLDYARRGYDGVLHLKSFGCIPELNAGPVLTRLSHREGMPILPLSFDTHTGELGVRTRIEAFVDMLRMRKGV